MSTQDWGEAGRVTPSFLLLPDKALAGSQKRTCWNSTRRSEQGGCTAAGSCRVARGGVGEPDTRGVVACTCRFGLTGRYSLGVYTTRL